MRPAPTSFAQPLFGTQRSPVQIRAARPELPGQGLRILRRLAPPKQLARKWRGDFWPSDWRWFSCRSPWKHQLSRKSDRGNQAFFRHTSCRRTRLGALARVTPHTRSVTSIAMEPSTECEREFVFCGCCVTGNAPTQTSERSLHVGRPLGVQPTPL